MNSTSLMSETVSAGTAGSVLPRRRVTDRPAEPGLADARPRNAVSFRDSVYRRLLAVADLCAVAGAIAAIGLTVAPRYVTASTLIAFPLIVLLAKTMGLYHRDELVIHKTTLNEAPALFNLTAVVTLAIVATTTAVGGTGFAFLPLAIFFVTLLVGTLTARVIARRIGRAVTPAEKCVLVGDIEHADRIKRMLNTQPSLNAELVATVPFDRVTARGEDADAFGDYLAQSDFHRVIVPHTERGFSDMLETIRVFKSRGIKVSVLPGLFEVLGSGVEFDDISGSTLLGVRSYGLSRSSTAMKRTMDAILSLIGLIALAPLLAGIALAVRLDSRGPIFFKQTRVGRGDRRFQILKFRTMCQGADDMKPTLATGQRGNGLFKLPGDPRVTRLGRLLRSSSLDELPQLFNVLRGDMSLVGPRPLVVDEDSQVEGWHRRRLDLTPGMTGVWQVLPSTRVPLEEMVALDYLYIVDWSLWSDVQILLRTIPHVLGRRGM